MLQQLAKGYGINENIGVATGGVTLTNVTEIKFLISYYLPCLA
jgi:hypothetical protein